MSTVLARPTNGVSYGLRYVVTSDDVGTPMTFDFQVDYDLVASVMITDASGVMVDMSDAVITYPAAGQVQIEDGASTFAFAQDQVVHIVAQRAA